MTETAGPDPAAVVGIGITVLFALGVALWRAASLRGDVNQKWSSRVDAAASALTDRAINELQALRRETDKLLGAPGTEEPPVLASVDPSPLVTRAGAVARYSETRDRMNRQLTTLLKVAPLLVPVLLLLIACDVLLTIDFADIAQYRGVRFAGFVSGGAGGAVGAVLFGYYLFVQHRLSGAELLGERGAEEGDAT